MLKPEFIMLQAPRIMLKVQRIMLAEHNAVGTANNALNNAYHVRCTAYNVRSTAYNAISTAYNAISTAYNAVNTAYNATSTSICTCLAVIDPDILFRETNRLEKKSNCFIAYSGSNLFHRVSPPTRPLNTSPIRRLFLRSAVPLLTHPSALWKAIAVFK